MAEQKKFRKIMATASALAILVASNVAHAAQYVGTGGGVTIENGANTLNSTGSSTPWAAGDSFASVPDGSASGVIFGNAGTDATIGTYDLNKGGAVPITVADNSSVGSIINSGNADLATMVVNNGKKIAFGGLNGLKANGTSQTAGNFSALNSIMLGNGAGGASMVVSNPSATFIGAIDSDAAKNATLTVNAGASVSFNKVGATNKLSTISLDNAAIVTFTEGFVADNLELTGVTTTATIADGKNADALIDGTTANQGILSFAGASIVSKKIGSTQALKKVQVGTGIVDFADTVTAETVCVGSGAASFSKDLTAKIKFTADGKVTIEDKAKLTGDVTTAAANTGTISFDANSEVNGVFGAATSALKAVNFLGAGTVDVKNVAAGNHHAKAFNFSDNIAILKLSANQNLNGNLVAINTGNGQIIFTGAGSVTGTIGTSANKFNSITSSTDVVKIGTGDHYLLNGFAIDNLATAGYSFANGVKLNADILTTGANGIVTFEGDATVNGEIGFGGALTSLTIDGTTGKKVIFSQDVDSTITTITNGATVEFVGTTKIGGIDIKTNSGNLVINGDTSFTTGDITIAAHTNPASIEITNVVSAGGARTISFGQIGDSLDATKKLNLLKVNANTANDTTILLTPGSHIESIELHNQKSILDFGTSSGAGSYKFAGITPQTNDFGTIKIVDTTELKTGGTGVSVNIGTATAKLANLEFAADKSLQLEDGVNLYATKMTNTAGQGSIIFEGKNIFNAPNTNELKSITLNTNSNLDLKSQLAATDVTLGLNATLSLGQELTSKNGINGAIASNGILKLVNTAAMEIKTNVGTTNVLQQIQLAGSDVSVATGKQLLADEYKFTSANDVKFTLSDVTAKYNGKFSNTSATNINHTVILNKAITEFAGDIIASNKINFQLDSGKDAKITAADVSGANFTTLTSGKGNLDLAKTNLVMNKIGKSDSRLDTVTFTENATTTSIYATDVVVAAGKIATLAETVDISNTISLNAASVASFKDGALINAKIDGAIFAFGDGDVIFEGSATINQSIGGTASVNSIQFSADATDTAVINNSLVLDANKSIAFNKGAVQANNTNPITISLNGPVTMTDSNINLFDSKATVNGSLNINGANKFAVNVVDKSGTLVNGQLVVANNLTVNPSATVAVTLNDQATPRIGKYSTNNISVIVSSAPALTAFDPAKVTVVNDNLFNKWTAKSGPNGGLNFEQSDNTPAAISVLSKSISTSDMTNLEIMCDAADNTGASNFLDSIAQFTDGNGGFTDGAVEVIERLDVANVSEVLVNTVMSVSSGMSSRLDHLAGGYKFVSAGEEDRYGAWVTPFIGTATQKETSDVEGYKTNTYGGSVGFDSKVNPDTIIGAAITAGYSKVDHQGDKSGDDSRIDLLAFSLYSKYQLNDRWSAQSVATFANNSVRSKEQRLIGISGGVNQYDTIKSDYNAMSFSAESMINHNYMTNFGAFTRIMGLRYSRLNTAGYQQTGSTNGTDLYVITKPVNRLDVVLGARLTGESYYASSIMVSPEIHAFVSHDIINKDGTTSLGMDGASESLISKAGKLSKTLYNVGFSLTSEYSIMEYGLGYDAHFADKRIGHQGTLKLRVNF